MKDREQMIEIVSNAKKACAQRYGCASCRYKRGNQCLEKSIVDALIEAGFERVNRRPIDPTDEELDRQNYKLAFEAGFQRGRADRVEHRVEVLERALVIMAEGVLEYAKKAKVMATTSDGSFSCEMGAQLALLANDALRKAEQKMTEEKKEKNK